MEHESASTSRSLVEVAARECHDDTPLTVHYRRDRARARNNPRVEMEVSLSGREEEMVNDREKRF